MKKALAVLILLVSVATVVANDGYTFRNGLWYYPGYTNGYTRTLITTPSYYSRGCLVVGSSYYQYTEVPIQVVAQPVAPSYAPDWKVEAIKFAQAQADYAAYQATLNALGVYQQQPQQLFGANASTNYGYTYNSVAQAYGDTSVAQLYQQYAQNVSNAQRLGGEALVGHGELIAKDSFHRSRVAEILAKGQSAEQIIRSFNNPNSFSTQTTVTFKKSPQLDALQNVIGMKCASCHSGNNRKGGIDISNYLSFTPEQKQRVFAAITNPDPRAVMPKGAERLTPAELQLFLQN